MEKLNGFIVGRAFPGDPNYMFGKIKRHGVKSDEISLTEYLRKEKMPPKNAAVLVGEDYTLCLTNYINAKNIKYLSVLERCMIFEYNFEQRTTKFQVFKEGEMIGEKEFPLSFSMKKESIKIGLYGIVKETEDIEETVLRLFDVFTKGMHLKSPISTFLRHRKLVNYALQTPSLSYILPGYVSTNATPFYGDKEKIMSLMPLANGYPLSYENDFDDSPMTQEKYYERIMQYIRFGVVSPAVLIQHNPLCVSVYSYEQDAVLILNYNTNSKIAQQFKDYKLMTKLLSVNLFNAEAPSGLTEGLEIDIIEGPKSNKRWNNFVPHIVDFLVDDRDKPLLDYWKRKISKEKWSNTVRLTKEYAQRYPGGFRIGFLMYSQMLSLSFVKKFYPEYLDSDNIMIIGKKRS